MARSRQSTAGSAQVAATQAPAQTAGAAPSEGASALATSAEAAGSGEADSANQAASSVSEDAAGAGGAGDQPPPPVGDNPSEQAQGGDVAAPPAEASVSAGVPDAPLASEAASDPEPFFEILDGHVSRSEVIAGICSACGLEREQFDALPQRAQARAIDLSVGMFRTAATVTREIRALVTPQSEDTVYISAKSRDGKPYIRAGQTWTGEYQTLPVPERLADKVRNDPNLLVKAD